MLAAKITATAISNNFFIVIGLSLRKIIAPQSYVPLIL
jgi:hypothetical protein